MAMTFRYVHVPREDGTLRRAPFIPVFIKNKFGKVMKVIALLDSGADDTVVPKDLAEILGLIEKGKELDTGGIGGSVKVKKSSLSFQIKNDHETHSLIIPALVLQDLNVDVPLLLGRNGFFDNFHVTFKQSSEKIVLKKINSKKYFY